MNQEPEIKVQNLDHLGILHSIFDKIKLIERVDQILPKKGTPTNLSHGQVLAALIFSGLGQQKIRFYHLKNFFEKYPIQKLLGANVTADKLNDDVLLRTLDRIYEYGPSNFFWISLSRPSSMPMSTRRKTI